MSKATPPEPALAAQTIEISTPMEQFLEANFKKLVLLFALIALAAAAYGVVSYTSRANAIAAGEAFAAAKTVEDCDRVISEYQGTVAAGNALLLKADLLWAQNKKDSSVAALREFTTKNTGHPLVPQALLGLGTKLESMKEAGEARAAYERVTSEFASNDVAALAQVRLGDLLWSEGKEAEAKAAYEAVPAKFANADADFIEQSEGRLKWIASKLPTKEVDGPPKPKVETPAAPVPGAPKLNLNSPTLTPTLLPGGAQAAPQLQVTPAPSPAAPAAPKIEVTPLSPTVTPEAATPAPTAPAPAPVAPAPAPQVEVKPAPAAAPAPVPAAPAAPAAPAPVPAAPVAPAPAPAPAAPDAPAPAAPKAP